MPRRENSIYDGDPLPRNGETERMMWRNKPRAKKHPKYVHGKIGMSALLHKIAYVDMQWYDYDYNFIYRLKHPILMAHTNCGMFWRLEAGRGNTCEMPAPETVLCAACHGEGRNFGKQGKTKVSKRQAKDSLGCIAEGTEI